MCIQQLRTELESKYGEWLEIGHSLENILLVLLEKERESISYYKKILSDLQNSGRR